MKIRRFFLLILIFGAILFLSGCSENTENLEIEKGLSEIRFLENQCSTIFKKWLTEAYLDEGNQIQWELVQEDYHMMHTAVDVILIDMASLQIPSKSIVELENHLEDLNIYVQSKEWNSTMKEICDIYDLLVNTILDSLSKEKWVNQEKKCKSDLLYVAYYLMKFQKEETLSFLDTFQSHYADLSNDQEYLENNAYKVNRVFMNTQKLKTSIETENFNSAKENLYDMFLFFEN